MKKEPLKKEDAVWLQVKGKIEDTHKADIAREEQFERRIDRILLQQQQPVPAPKSK